MVVRNVINSSIGGGKKNDYASLGNAGELLIVIDILFKKRGRGKN